jgi:DNA-binding NarL/FixJ family response regulator
LSKSKIFIVDDHPLVREWLTTLIDQTTDLEVCDGAGDAQGALQGIARSKPDLAIIDLSLGSESGIDLLRAIGERFPKVATVVLSMHDERAYAERSLRAVVAFVLLCHFFFLLHEKQESKEDVYTVK